MAIPGVPAVSPQFVVNAVTLIAGDLAKMRPYAVEEDPETGVEAEVNGFRTERKLNYSPNPFQASGVLVMGNALLYLGPLYLVGGAGLLHIRNQVGFSGEPANRSGSGFAVDVGGGVRIPVTRHIVLRPEVRVYSGDSGQAVERPFTDIRFSMAAGYCW